MTPRFLDDDGSPRYGARVSPEELEAIRREQGIDPPAPSWPEDGAPDQPRWSQGWGPDDDPYARPGSSPHPTGPSGERSPEPEAATWDREQDARARRRNVRTLVVGLLLMLLVPLGLVTAAVWLVADGGLTSGQVLSASGQVYLERGQSVGLYSSGAAGVLDCSVAGPDGAAVTVEGVPGANVAYLSFVASQQGVHTVSCEGGAEGIVAGPAMRTDRALPASALVMTGLVVGLVGLVVTVVAVVRLVRRR